MADKKSLRFLVIDDNEMARGALRAIINSGDGYAVIGAAANGVSGLELTRRLRPDVVCLDVLMPTGSGLDVLEQIKKESPAPAVVMITAMSDADTIQKATQLGASGFIAKPFSAGKVLDTLDHVAEQLRP